MPDEHSEIWAQIDKLRDIVNKQSVDTGKLLTAAEPMIKFVERVRDGNCPMGIVHAMALETLKTKVDAQDKALGPVLVTHEGWLNNRRLIISTLITTAVAGIMATGWTWHNATLTEASSRTVMQELNAIRAEKLLAVPPVIPGKATAPIPRAVAPTSRSKADTPKPTLPHEPGIVTRMRKPAPKAGG